MAYTLCTSVALGSSKAGLTLAAQLVDDEGQDAGDEITSGFAEIGGGNYLWTYDAFADGFRGGVKFYQDGVPGTVLAFCAINPSDVGAGGGASVEDILAADVDSTGEGLTLKKALEVAVARAVGNVSYNQATGVLSFYGRDGVTVIASFKLLARGVRSQSTIV